ncbi:ankyrin repeat, SAM and basic leucine zipper domain-containing protein 1-like isoform X1 [Hylaeus anthracinus]|uniref:ankyrin repeat, SAM and basic leucine zipper domain-containing protein 1-like isoform X1 n=2 Tax=Hylaeus anthracinus TaxID=313031 RepID=UPI0023B9C8CC|nr:ankyrin repeat, SAM and basic leucine zipper domain-containing protein 1-like isoform X1 [Hylaeus anthracinus]
MDSRDTEISDNELDDDEDYSLLRKKWPVSKNMNTFDPYDDINIDDKRFSEYRMLNACMTGHLGIVQEYLQLHNVNEFLCTGWTPLLYAALYAQEEVIGFLITNGADVNKHKDGYTPLMALCSCTKGTSEKRIKCLSLLIKANANANTSNKQRQTPLMYACTSQEPEFIQELIKYAKNVNICDSRKQTALIYATIANKPDIVKILIENGADVTLTDYDSLTAKDIAFMKGYNEINSLLNLVEENEELSIHKISKITDWKDMFPSLTSINDQTIDFDVFTIVHGMALDKYIHIFQGMSIKVFLKLTENDLCSLGIDINAHRVQFMENLHKFHRKKWSIYSIGAINKSLPYTLYDGIVSLGTVARQIAVIGSSFQYIQNSFTKANDENICLTTEQISNYEQELKKTQKTLGLLKKELIQVKALSKRVKKENNIGIPATYIGPKKHTFNWLIPLGMTAIMGIYLYRTFCIQRLVNI